MSDALHPSAYPPADFLLLIQRMCDGTATLDDRDQLEDQIHSSKEVRDSLLTYLDLHAELQWYYRGEASESNSPTVGRPAVAPANFLLTPVKSFLGRANAALSYPVVWSILAVAVVFYGTFAIFSWNLRPEKLPSRAGDNGAPVAVMRDAADVQWSNNTFSKSADASILGGESLKIDSGTMELELKSGARLVVEGPAEWSVDGHNSVSLQAGKLLAHVPQQAIGFTVETPTAKIVDLGTEFGVEANPDGTTAVKVVQGNVTLATNNENQDYAKQFITLKAGEARKVFREDHSRKLVIGEIAPSSVRIPQQRAASGPRRIMVQGTMESSSRTAGCTAVRLIDGSGMHGNSHSSSPDEGMPLGSFNMWLTPFGKVRNEFVLFDLGLEYRLHSMKVWNFNDGRHNMHLARGLKQADIYVSTSGRGNPLSDPKDWKLVAENHTFPPASGTAGYDTPEVLEFDQIRARFVAIVVDDHFGPDPGVPEVCVGLSEVQFFGDRTTTP